MANLLNFKFGKYTNLPETKSAGTVYVTTDERAMYVDLPNATNVNQIDRIRIGDIIIKDNVRDIEPPYYTDAFYYCRQENALLRWDGSEWKQINSTAAVEAQIKNVQNTLNQEIAARTAADTKHTQDIAAANTAISERLTIADFNSFKSDNDEALAGLDTRITAAQARADKGVADAANAQTTANKGVTDAANAKSAADQAQATADKGVADAKAANDNANTRLTTVAFNEFKAANDTELGTIKTNVNTAQTTANKGVSDAAAAKEQADKGVADAAAALAKANQMLPLAGGTMTGAIDMNSKAITNVLAPSANGDAANKKYVDDTKTTLNNLITTAQNTANTAKDTADKALPKAGGTMTGPIAMSSNKITGLAGPEDDADAANKKYVDDAVNAGIATSDAMVYKGIIGSASALNAITTANKGDTYKISAAFTTGSGSSEKKYRVGDILINSGADGAAPTWDHITSGYEDDYLQKLAADTTNATVHLTDGVTNTATGSVGGIKFVGANTSNIVMSVTAGTGNNPVHTVTASMVWGEF